MIQRQKKLHYGTRKQKSAECLRQVVSATFFLLSAGCLSCPNAHTKRSSRANGARERNYLHWNSIRSSFQLRDRIVKLLLLSLSLASLGSLLAIERSAYEPQRSRLSCSWIFLRNKLAQMHSLIFSIYPSLCRTNNKTDTNMEKDVDTAKPNQAAVIDTSSVLALPIVIKIEPPRDAVKQKNDKTKAGCAVDDVNKPTKSRLCQLLPVLLFVVTFATVLTALIVYMDPSSEFHDSFRINYRELICRAPRRPRLRSIKVPFKRQAIWAKIKLLWERHVVLGKVEKRRMEGKMVH